MCTIHGSAGPHTDPGVRYKRLALGTITYLLSWLFIFGYCYLKDLAIFPTYHPIDWPRAYCYQAQLA